MAAARDDDPPLSFLVGDDAAGFASDDGLASDEPDDSDDGFASDDDDEDADADDPDPDPDAAPDLDDERLSVL